MGQDMKVRLSCCLVLLLYNKASTPSWPDLYMNICQHSCMCTDTCNTYMHIHHKNWLYISHIDHDMKVSFTLAHSDGMWLTAGTHTASCNFFLTNHPLCLWLAGALSCPIVLSLTSHRCPVNNPWSVAMETGGIWWSNWVCWWAPIFQLDIADLLGHMRMDVTNQWQVPVINMLVLADISDKINTSCCFWKSV